MCLPEKKQGGYALVQACSMRALLEILTQERPRKDAQVLGQTPPCHPPEGGH
jgi:hypothetical protein